MVAFAWWELHTDEPMLDVSFFKNPRFTAASSAITLVFFAMFGFSFLLTQYFQFVLGYTAMETGIRMLPLALTLMVVAPLSPAGRREARIEGRRGDRARRSSRSRSCCARGLQVDSPYGQIVWRMMLLALGMGLTMAPATESVMGSLPLAKAGVGSAVNDTTRQVGGALGVAIVGSVLASVYGSKITDLFGGKVPRRGGRGRQGLARRGVRRSPRRPAAPRRSRSTPWPATASSTACTPRALVTAAAAGHRRDRRRCCSCRPTPVGPTSTPRPTSTRTSSPKPNGRGEHLEPIGRA